MEKGKQSLHTKTKEINELKQELEDTEIQAEVKVQQLKIALQQKEQECKRRMKKLQLTLAAREVVLASRGLIARTRQSCLRELHRILFRTIRCRTLSIGKSAESKKC